MSDSTLKSIVHWDGVIETILCNAPDRAVELLLQEHKLCHDQASFIAAALAKLVLIHHMTKRAKA